MFLLVRFWSEILACTSSTYTKTRAHYFGSWNLSITERLSPEYGNSTKKAKGYSGTPHKGHPSIKATLLSPKCTLLVQIDHRDKATPV